MQPKGIILHHPAMSQAVINQQAGKALIDTIRYEHVHGNGWLDIGYHYIVHKDTNGEFKVFDGRPDSMPGAHTYGWNDWLGVCVAYGMGTTPPEAQLAVISKLIAALCKTYNLPIDSDHIKGHRDMPGHTSNECPGNQLYALIPSLISKARSDLNPPKLPPQKPAIKPPVPTIEAQLHTIKVEMAPEPDFEGLLFNNQAYIHAAKLKDYGFTVDYIKANGEQPQKIVIKRKTGG